ncbi:nucleoside triphosphate pyrophosphatase [Massilia sp. W12]|uniref:Maf family protein n=1 Tax=Massilia sp. W12 TaxID=3126507 RepID=UPI0030CB4189
MKLDKKIWLASKSPRRRELLRQIGVDFEILFLREQAPRGPDVTELAMPGEAAADYVRRVTLEKVACAAHVQAMRHLPLRPILCADTTVSIDGDILGKPANNAEAQAMLRRLAGRRHQVLTSIALHWQEQTWQHTQVSQVEFSPLNDAQIVRYCSGSEPYDKAGGYGIQGQAAAFISHIEGSYSGIMGLPLYDTLQLLQQAGFAP